MRSRRFRGAALAAVAAVALTSGVAIGADIRRPPLPDPGLVLPDIDGREDPAGVLAGKEIRGVVLENTCRWPVPDAVDFARLKAIGVNTIQIVLCGFVSSREDSTVEVNRDTPTDVEISALVNLAHLHGFAVQLIPSWGPLRDIPYFWRGYVRPTDRAMFFATYQSLVEHWASLAEQLDVEIFALGTEGGWYMERFKKYWKRIATAVDSRFTGLTTYQATSGSAFSLKWWHRVDLISLSAYWSLTNRPNPALGALQYVWDKTYLPLTYRKLYQVHRKPILFSEVGYASLAGAATNPALGNRMKPAPPRSENEQAVAYEALLDMVALRGNWFRGIVWFRWDVGGVGPLDRTFSFKDKKAECVLARAWSPGTINALNVLRGTRAACVAVSAVD